MIVFFGESFINDVILLMLYCVFVVIFVGVIVLVWGGIW